ncbi:TonB-dependent receptor [Brevundimonas sp.]|uniref:TonB-dependent receptor n=1 Tax=Brevundimonas sp. TaxID=1871086 RepID=UPI00286C54F0|nr:TonB-dependent receptor [Brevundimonas sp.]
MTTAALLAAGMIALQSGAPQTFDVRAGPAAQSVNRLAAQAGIDIVITTNLNGRRTPDLRGRMSPEAALDRMLRPLGARAVRIGEGMYRVEAAPVPPRRPLVRPPPPPEIAPTLLNEVVVTAMPPVGLGGVSGRDTVDRGALQRVEGAAASDAVSDLSATVESTRQGTGRNKLFIRGLADSAMNGPLQATVGQYLGDLRLNYGSPDPDLALIDVRRIEVFEGPQGTRFGAGSIGGVLRLQPEEPAFRETTGRFVVGAGVTSGGAESTEASLVVNRSLDNRTAGRVVAYSRREGGFLDNPTQGVREADTVDTVGGRASVRWTDGDWTVDLVGVGQRVTADDAQTTAIGAARFVKLGRVLEPYQSTIVLAGLTAQRRLGSAVLTSATSISRQQLNERFDASQVSEPFPELVDRRQTATTTSTELRIDTDPIAGWTWSGGAALAVGETLVERRRRDLSPTPRPTYGADLRRTFTEATAFGEASMSPADDWRIALGARLSAVKIDSDVSIVDLASARAGPQINGFSLRVTPSLTARWDATPAATVFARAEQAVRPAGVNEANGAFQRYNGDRVTLVEVGARSRQWRDDLSGEVSIGWVDWRDVQADIVTQGGDLVTDNVGDGVIRFVSIKGSWTPTPMLDISGGVFVNDSELTQTRFSIIGGGTTDIPNVAPFGAQLSVDYDAGTLGGLPLRLGADFRYIGQSRIGVGPSLDVPQGGYTRSELTARLGDERRAATLRISNPLNQDGVRYGIGSPYQLTSPQAVPVRPLTVRLAFEAAF